MSSRNVLKNYYDVQVSLFSVLMGIGILYYRLKHPIGGPFENQNIGIVADIFITLGVSLGIYLFYMKFSAKVSEKTTKRIFGISIFVFSVFLGVFIFFVGNRLFNAFDCSLLVDTAYRVYSGQKPCIDFFCPLPPGFYLPLKYAFTVFGCTWDSILILTIIFSIITFVWMCILLYQITKSSVMSFVVSAACQSVAILVPSHWWYNSITSISAGVFLCSAILAIVNNKKIYWVSYFFSMTILFTMKPNVALIMIGGVIVVSMFSHTSRIKSLIFLCLSMLCCVILLNFNGIDVMDVVDSYIAISASKLSPDLHFPRHPLGAFDEYENLLVFMFLLTPIFSHIILLTLKLIEFCKDLIGLILDGKSVLYILSFLKKKISAKIVHIRVVLLVIVGLLSGFAGIVLSTDSKFSDYPLLILVIGILPFIYKSDSLFEGNLNSPQTLEDVIQGPVGIPRFEKEGVLTTRESGKSDSLFEGNLNSPQYIEFLKKTGFVISSCVLVLGVLIGAYRYRTSLGGPFFEMVPFFNVGQDKYKSLNHFFDDMFEGEQFSKILNQIDDVVNKNRKKKFFFITRMEFAYAAFGLESPKNLPIWWHPGTGYPIKDQEKIINNWLNNKFDVIIANKDDINYIPQQIMDSIKNDYIKNVSYGNLSVFYRKSF